MAVHGAAAASRPYVSSAAVHGGAMAVPAMHHMLSTHLLGSLQISITQTRGHWWLPL